MKIETYQIITFGIMIILFGFALKATDILVKIFLFLVCLQFFMLIILVPLGEGGKFEYTIEADLKRG